MLWLDLGQTVLFRYFAVSSCSSANVVGQLLQVLMSMPLILLQGEGCREGDMNAFSTVFVQPGCGGSDGNVGGGKREVL